MREFKSQKKQVISTSLISTPIGDMLCASSKKGICILSFYTSNKIDEQISKVKKELNAEFLPGHNIFFDQLKIQLNEYFNKKREVFDIPLHIIGTSFQKEVWKVLLNIPYSKTISYQEEAKLMSKEKACRAVANANAKNMISIIIPCHRVIQKNGKLGGYAGGVMNKDFLLSLER